MFVGVGESLQLITEESEYVNTYCLIMLLLFIIDIINNKLVLVELHNIYEHI